MAQKINPRSLRTRDFNGANAMYADTFYGKLLHHNWNNQTKFLELFTKSKRFKVIKAPSRRRRVKPSLLAASLLINQFAYKSVFAGIMCKHLPKLSKRQNLPFRPVRKKHTVRKKHHKTPQTRRAVPSSAFRLVFPAKLEVPALLEKQAGPQAILK